jgi:pSer/pThr/pTyr-binding forkhead associated (FHA) protein
LTGLPAPGDLLTRRLEYVADLLADAGPLPKEPLLLWRPAGQAPRHALIGQELVVGRNTGQTGLTLSDDAGLSRRHFLVRRDADSCVLEDLKSRNGVAINRPEQRVQQHVLRDGDLILAGTHIFVFLDHGRQR